MKSSFKIKLTLVSTGGERRERDWESLTEQEKQMSRARRTERFMKAAGYEVQGA